MKIIYPPSIFPKLSETFIMEQITGLIDPGHDVHVVAYCKSNVRKFWPDLVSDKVIDRKNGNNKTMPPSMPICKFAYRNLFVWPNGNVTFSCCSKRVIGNINNRTIYEIRNSEAAVDERKRFQAGNYENCNINCQSGYSFAGKKAVEYTYKANQ